MIIKAVEGLARKVFSSEKENIVYPCVANNGPLSYIQEYISYHRIHAFLITTVT